MALTIIVLRCARCSKPAEYTESGPGRSKIDRQIRADGWKRRLNGKRLEWVCGECHATNH